MELTSPLNKYSHLTNRSETLSYKNNQLENFTNPTRKSARSRNPNSKYDEEYVLLDRLDDNEEASVAGKRAHSIRTPPSDFKIRDFPDKRTQNNSDIPFKHLNKNSVSLSANLSLNSEQLDTATISNDKEIGNSESTMIITEKKAQFDESDEETEDEAIDMKSFPMYLMQPMPPPPKTMVQQPLDRKKLKVVRPTRWLHLVEHSNESSLSTSKSEATRRRKLKRSDFPIPESSSKSVFENEIVKKPRIKTDLTEIAFNTGDDSTTLRKPHLEKDYIGIIEWCVSQLPNREGTLSEIMQVLRKNAWDNIDTRNVLIFQNLVPQVLFRLRNVSDPVYCCSTTPSLIHSKPIQIYSRVSKKPIVVQSTIPQPAQQTTIEKEAAPISKTTLDTPQVNTQIEPPKEKAMTTTASYIQQKIQENLQVLSRLFPNQLADTKTKPNEDQKKKKPSPEKSPSLSKQRKPSGVPRSACDLHRRLHLRCPIDCPNRPSPVINTSPVQ